LWGGLGGGVLEVLNHTEGGKEDSRQNGSQKRSTLTNCVTGQRMITKNAKCRFNWYGKKKGKRMSERGQEPAKSEMSNTSIGHDHGRL